MDRQPEKSLYPELQHDDDNYFGNSPPAEIRGYDATPDSGVHDLSNIDPSKIEEWHNELIKTEEEILTLQQVLSKKVKYAQELKRQLGISPWKEFREDMEQGLKTIQESNAYKGVSSRLGDINSSITSTPAYKDVSTKLGEWNSAVTSAPIYQKTSQTIKAAGEKTTSYFGSFTSSVGKKLGDVKNSTTFKSFEERVGSAYSNVKNSLIQAKESMFRS